MIRQGNDGKERKYEYTHTQKNTFAHPQFIQTQKKIAAHSRYKCSNENSYSLTLGLPQCLYGASDSRTKLSEARAGIKN